MPVGRSVEGRARWRPVDGRVRDGRMVGRLHLYGGGGGAPWFVPWLTVGWMGLGMSVDRSAGVDRSGTMERTGRLRIGRGEKRWWMRRRKRKEMEDEEEEEEQKRGCGGRRNDDSRRRIRRRWRKREVTVITM